VILFHVSYRMKLSLACVEVSHMADDNKDTVFWVGWLCLSQMGNGTECGTAESAVGMLVCYFIRLRVLCG